MDFKDALTQLSERVERLKDNLLTEEATKNALIMPFLQALGYDVFNPLEVLPEFICDIGAKKGEKIDYAILKDGAPVMIIECKHWKQDLSLHDNQLLRYFHVTPAKFGLLTNGIVYKFYTDLETPNRMDEKPFFEINLTDLRSSQIEEVKKFHKSYFDVGRILSSASELKYLNALNSIFKKEFAEPSIDFVKFFGKQIYEGRLTDKMVEQLSPLVKKSINSYVNGQVSERLKAAIKSEEEPTKEIVKEETDKGIVTTDAELQAFYIVKAILTKVVPANRIVFKDSIDYFAINIDHMYKNICRLYFNNSENLRIAFRTEDKKEERIHIDTLDEIYEYADRLTAEAEKYK